MITVAIVFVIVLVVLVAIRRGLFSRFSGVSRGPAAPWFSRAADDAPPQASAWEMRLLADALDDHRRDRAKATLFAELRAISEPAAAAPVASSPAKSADLFA